MDKALGYLGLAARAGKLKTGAEDCAKELKKRKGGLLIAAADASANTLDRAAAMTAGREERLFRTDYTKRQIADAVGRATPVALALLCDEGLAKAFKAAAHMDRGEQEERV